MANENPNSGTDTGLSTVNTGSGGYDWEKLISNIFGGVTGAVGGGGNAATLGIVAALMQMLQKQMDKSVTSPKEAVGTSEVLRSAYTNKLNETGVPQSATNSALAAVTNRANTPSIQPTVTAPTSQPARFNPYANSGGIGGAAPNLMSKLSGIVNTPNPSQAWGQNLATNSLANRYGTRPMAQKGIAGALTPQPLPVGATNTNMPATSNVAAPAPNIPSTPGTPPNITGVTPTPTQGAATPEQVQADFAIFQKGAATPGYLAAAQRLMNYFNSGKTGGL